MNYMTFMEAMECLDKGYKVARYSWCDGAYLWYQTGKILNEGDEPYIVTIDDIQATDWVNVFE